MIVSTIRKTMKTALKTFATIEKKDPTLIEVVIHTKNSESLYSTDHLYLADFIIESFKCFQYRFIQR